MIQLPPPINGVVASRVQLPQRTFATLLDGLCALFPAISREHWAGRFGRGRVLDADGKAIALDAPYRTGIEVYYYREVVDESRMPPGESVLYIDAHLVVADKPHGLPVTPAGGYVEETLQARLIRELKNPDLVPLHRIDRDTAGLVLFSADPGTRDQYHAVFREKRIAKRYEALAPPLLNVEFPYTRRSRLARGEPFFRMREVEGEPNSETHVCVLDRGSRHWLYGLQPLSGRKHQLRVQMAALGVPIVNDIWYPLLRDGAGSGRGGPLQLLAKTLAFIDPIHGDFRRYDSGFALDPVTM